MFQIFNFLKSSSLSLSLSLSLHVLQQRDGWNLDFDLQQQQQQQFPDFGNDMMYDHPGPPDTEVGGRGMGTATRKRRRDDLFDEKVKKKTTKT
jgi:hypothetical protein